jgi:hypothetical protein
MKNFMMKPISSVEGPCVIDHDEDHGLPHPPQTLRRAAALPARNHPKPQWNN